MEKKITHKERRKDLRISVPKLFTIKFRIKKEKGIFNLRPKKITRAENMSVGGIRIELPALDKKQIDRVIDGKDKLILELNIPYLKRPLRFTGKIVWLAKKDLRGKTTHVAGLSFEGLKGKDAETILHQLINLCLRESCNII